jgi:hypothetical protein
MDASTPKTEPTLRRSASEENGVRADCNLTILTAFRPQPTSIRGGGLAAGFCANAWQ